MEPLRVAVTVDVEEEGLFSGSYERRPTGLGNLAQLGRLEYITRDLGLPLTLLCTYPVVRDQACRDILLRWRDQLGAELGAHLHPWNTPPFGPEDQTEPHLAEEIEPPVLEAKLAALLAAHAEAFCAPARSFRMGRFDLPDALMAALGRHGIRVDSSLVPLRTALRGPDHFLAPDRPHQAHGILEAPLTMEQVLPGSARLVAGMAALMPDSSARLAKKYFRYIGVVGTQPTMFSLAAMKKAARLHYGRGGRTLVIILHSSELLPGASPDYSDEKAVAGLVDKLGRFLAWAGERFPLAPARLGDLAP